jgi:tetratricopeptide (TPR) repeat protein
VAIVTNNLGGQAYFEGRWEESLRFYSRAQDAFVRAGNEPEAATSGANIGEVLVSQGRFEEAEEVLVEAVRILRAHNLVDAAIFAEIQLARLRLLQDEEGAMDTLLALRTEATETGQIQSAIEAAILIAWGLMKRGEPQAALDTLAEAERGSGAEAELYGCSLARMRAQALAKLGHTDEARRAVEAGLAQAREQGLAYEEALLQLTEAELTQEPQTRKKLLEEAQGLLQQLGVVRTA